MMKIIKNTSMGIVAIVALLVAVSFFLPSKVHVERSATIKAPVDSLFYMVNELKNWGRWSAWAQIDPNGTKWVYSEPSSGQGAWYTWDSNNPDVGKGKLTIAECIPNKYLKNELDFDEMGTSVSEIFFDEAPKGTTTIKMTLDCDMGNNPVGKYMGLMMDKWVGDDYEKCFKNMEVLAQQWQ